MTSPGSRCAAGFWDIYSPCATGVFPGVLLDAVSGAATAADSDELSPLPPPSDSDGGGGSHLFRTECSVRVPARSCFSSAAFLQGLPADLQSCVADESQEELRVLLEGSRGSGLAGGLISCVLRWAAAQVAALGIDLDLRLMDAARCDDDTPPPPPPPSPPPPSGSDDGASPSSEAAFRVSVFPTLVSFAASGAQPSSSSSSPSPSPPLLPSTAVISAHRYGVAMRTGSSLSATCGSAVLLARHAAAGETQALPASVVSEAAPHEPAPAAAAAESLWQPTPVRLRLSVKGTLPSAAAAPAAELALRVALGKVTVAACGSGGNLARMTPEERGAVVRTVYDAFPDTAVFFSMQRPHSRLVGFVVCGVPHRAVADLLQRLDYRPTPGSGRYPRLPFGPLFFHLHPLRTAELRTLREIPQFFEDVKRHCGCLAVTAPLAGAGGTPPAAATTAASAAWCGLLPLCDAEAYGAPASQLRGLRLAAPTPDTRALFPVLPADLAAVLRRCADLGLTEAYYRGIVVRVCRTVAEARAVAGHAAFPASGSVPSSDAAASAAAALAAKWRAAQLLRKGDLVRVCEHAASAEQTAAAAAAAAACSAAAAAGAAAATPVVPLHFAPSRAAGVVGEVSEVAGCSCLVAFKDGSTWMLAAQLEKVEEPEQEGRCSVGVLCWIEEGAAEVQAVLEAEADAEAMTREKAVVDDEEKARVPEVAAEEADKSVDGIQHHRTEVRFRDAEHDQNRVCLVPLPYKVDKGQMAYRIEWYEKGKGFFTSVFKMSEVHPERGVASEEEVARIIAWMAGVAGVPAEGDFPPSDDAGRQQPQAPPQPRQQLSSMATAVQMIECHSKTRVEHLPLSDGYLHSLLYPTSMDLLMSRFGRLQGDGVATTVPTPPQTGSSTADAKPFTADFDNLWFVRVLKQKAGVQSVRIVATGLLVEGSPFAILRFREAFRSSVVFAERLTEQLLWDRYKRCVRPLTHAQDVPEAAVLTIDETAFARAFGDVAAVPWALSLDADLAVGGHAAPPREGAKTPSLEGGASLHHLSFNVPEMHARALVMWALVDDFLCGFVKTLQKEGSAARSAAGSACRLRLSRLRTAHCVLGVPPAAYATKARLRTVVFLEGRVPSIGSLVRYVDHGNTVAGEAADGAAGVTLSVIPPGCFGRVLAADATRSTVRFLPDVPATGGRRDDSGNERAAEHDPVAVVPHHLAYPVEAAPGRGTPQLWTRPVDDVRCGVTEMETDAFAFTVAEWVNSVLGGGAYLGRPALVKLKVKVADEERAASPRVLSVGFPFASRVRVESVGVDAEGDVAGVLPVLVSYLTTAKASATVDATLFSCLLAALRGMHPSRHAIRAVARATARLEHISEEVAAAQARAAALVSECEQRVGAAEGAPPQRKREGAPSAADFAAYLAKLRQDVSFIGNDYIPPVFDEWRNVVGAALYDLRKLAGNLEAAVFCGGDRGGSGATGAAEQRQRLLGAIGSDTRTSVVVEAPQSGAVRLKLAGTQRGVRVAAQRIARAVAAAGGAPVPVLALPPPRKRQAAECTDAPEAKRARFSEGISGGGSGVSGSMGEEECVEAEDDEEEAGFEVHMRAARAVIALCRTEDGGCLFSAKRVTEDSVSASAAKAAAEEGEEEEGCCWHGVRLLPSGVSEALDAVERTRGVALELVARLSGLEARAVLGDASSSPSGFALQGAAHSVLEALRCLGVAEADSGEVPPSQESAGCDAAAAAAAGTVVQQVASLEAGLPQCRVCGSHVAPRPEGQEDGGFKCPVCAHSTLCYAGAPLPGHLACSVCDAFPLPHDGAVTCVRCPFTYFCVSCAAAATASGTAACGRRGHQAAAVPALLFAPPRNDALQALPSLCAKGHLLAAGGVEGAEWTCAGCGSKPPAGSTPLSCKVCRQLFCSGCKRLPRDDGPFDALRSIRPHERISLPSLHASSAARAEGPPASKACFLRFSSSVPCRVRPPPVPPAAAAAAAAAAAVDAVSASQQRQVPDVSVVRAVCTAGSCGVRGFASLRPGDVSGVAVVDRAEEEDAAAAAAATASGDDEEIDDDAAVGGAVGSDDDDEEYTPGHW